MFQIRINTIVYHKYWKLFQTGNKKGAAHLQRL